MPPNDSKDLQTQADLQKSINDALRERAVLMQKVSNELGAQVQMQINLCKAMECKELEDVISNMKSVNEALGENRKKIDETTQATQGMNKALKKSNKASKIAKGALVGAFVGVKNAIGTAFGAFKSLLKGIVSLPGSVMRIGGAILGAWGTMTSGLMDMAQAGAGGGKPILDSLEKVRASFGDLAGPTSQAVTKSWKNLRREGGELAAGGASLTKIFGRGRAGVAAALDFMRESAEALGPVFHTMSEEIINSGASLVRIRKGLGMSDEALQNMARSAKANGQSFKGALDEVARSTAYLSKKFGISAKAIGKNFSEMQGDMATFGDYTKTEMAGVAAAMAKVGMEMKDLQGIVGKTDSFEGAADAVAGLSEAFGMQLDVMELMTADPAKKAEMLRDAFHQTGRAFEDMSRQEKAHLADLSGMSQEALQGFLDPSNAGMSFDDFTSAAQDGADGAISQAEANKILTKSIEKLNETMGGLSGKKGFLGLFLDGVKKGIARSPEFIGLMKDIRESMQIVYRAGKSVGKMLMELFSPSGPLYPVMLIFKEYFSPAKWKQRMDGVKMAFRNFVNMMRVDPSKALAGLLKELKAVFFDGDGGKFAQILKEGLIKGVDVIGSMIMGAIPTILGWIRDGLFAIISALKGESSFASGFFDDVAFPMIAGAWADLKSQAGPIIKQMGDAIMTLLNMFWDKYGDKITSFFTGILTTIFVASIMKAAAAAAVGAAVSWAVTELLNKIKTARSGLEPNNADGGDGSREQSLAENMKGVVDALKQLNKGDIAKAMAIAIGIVALIYGGLIAMTHAFKVSSDIVKQIAMEDILKTALVWATIAGTMMAISASLLMMKGTPWQELATNLALMVTTIAALGLVGAILVSLIAATADVEMGQIVSWGTTLAVAIAAAGIAIFVADSLFAQSVNWKALLKGLAVLGVVMVALGGIGWALTKILKDAATVEQMLAVGTIMEGLAKLMGIVTLVLPVAAILGYMLAATPWGTAGVALAVLGFYVLGVLAIAMVANLMPTIEILVGLAGKIPNIDAFNAVVNGIVGVMEAIGHMMGSLAKLGSVLKPSPFVSAQEKFSDSMGAMTTFVNTLLKDNLGPLIQTMVDLAKDSNITEKGVEAVKAISAMVGALAQIISAFSPSDPAMASLVEANSSFAGADAVEIMGAIQSNTKTMGTQATNLIKEVKKLFTGKDNILDALKGVDMKGAEPVLKMIGPMLQGVASMMSSMGPGDSAWGAVTEAADTWGEDSVETINAMNRMMQAQGPQIRSFIRQSGKEVSAIIGALAPIMSSLSTSKADPALFSAFGNIVAATMGGMSSMMKTVGNVVGSLRDMAASGGKKGQQNRFSQMMNQVKSLIQEISTAMQSIMPIVGTMVEKLIGLSKGVTEPEKVKAGVEAVMAAFEILGMVSNLFSTGGGLSNVGAGENPPDISPLETAATSMSQLVSSLFSPIAGYPDGIMGSLIDAITGIVIKDPAVLASKTEALSKMFEALGTMASTMQTLSNMNEVLDADGNKTGDTGRLAAIFESLAVSFSASERGIPAKINRIVEGMSTITTKIPSPKRVESINAFAEKLIPLTNNLTGLTSIPDNIGTKIAEVEASITQLVTLMTNVGSNPELKTALNIGKALSADGKVTVKHENVSINLSVSVTLDALDFAKVMVQDKQYLAAGTAPLTP